MLDILTKFQGKIRILLPDFFRFLFANFTAAIKRAQLSDKAF